PIELRNPICFYEGHLPAFGVNTLIKRGLGRPGVDSNLEVLFERGIDPEDAAHVPTSGNGWPSRAVVQDYGNSADRLVAAAIEREGMEAPKTPVLAGGLALYPVLEHEPMHQETLGYMWHRLPYDRKIAPSGAPAPVVDGPPPDRSMARVPAGRATLGAARGEGAFGWAHELPRPRGQL